MNRVILFLVAMFGMAAGCSAADRSTPDAGQASSGEVNLLAMGDWGTSGVNQRTVAATMAEHVKASGRTFNALLTAGDNFYVKLTGVDDSKWRTIFEEMYNPAILNFPFYIAVGNHDYEINDAGVRKWQIQLDYAKANPNSRWKFPNRWYRVEFPSVNPLVTVFMLDSDRTLMGDELWAQQNAWLKEELAKPRTSTWTIGVAHHPFISNGDHGDNGVLQKTWGPLFAEYGVDFYICGHDHDLQHIESPEFKQSLMLVGGGGATTRPMRNDKRGPFSTAMYGFADLNFTPDLATVRLIGGKNGDVLHAFTRTPDGKVTVIRPGKSDIATTRTVKSITRGGSESTTAPAVAK